MQLKMSAALSVLSLVSMVSCVGEPESTSEAQLTWEQFKSTVYQEPDTGIYIVNGDEAIETEAGLRVFYDRLLLADEARLSAKEGIGTAQQPLIVNVVSGRDDKWSAAEAQNITYCVSSSSFGSRYNAVVSALSSATADWEGAARVNFVHDSSQDARCTKNTGVVFNVRQVCTGRYLARAFFPSTSRSGREILVDCTSFGNISPWTLTGVLRHELGHTIGFRHEHTRPESGTCFEDSSWRPLTPYDSSSVMHYPQCNGSNNRDLVLTSADRSGASSLYP